VRRDDGIFPGTHGPWLLGEQHERAPVTNATEITKNYKPRQQVYERNAELSKRLIESV
jgi:hypothetical protein